LPWTRDGVNAIAELFESDNRPASILFGADAGESNLERVAASGKPGKFGVIHLATHAVIDEGVPARSAAILTQTGSPDPLDQASKHKPVFDGLLSVREIQRGWELNAELAILSACKTALGGDSGGEGLVGFTQALLMSGARSVCRSLWQVDDRATALLMTRFHRNWLGKRPGLEGSLSKIEALREAKQWLRNLTDKEVKLELKQISRGEDPFKSGSARPKSFEHPFYCAGFIFMGDPS
jgi:CHAT domain-containing protein